MKLLAFAAAVLLLPTMASAQSLAEAAAKEREKKKHQKPTAKVFTDDDLQKAGQSGRGAANTSGATPAASPSPGETVAKVETAGAPAQKTAEQMRAELEQAWREKLKKATDEVTRLTQLQDTIQRNLNDITGNIYGSQRTMLLGELEKTRTQLQAAVAQVETLNEEGRRNNYR